MYRFILSCIHLSGRCLGWIALVFKTEYARVCRINLNLVFPELSADEIDSLVKKNLIEYGKLALEMIFNWFIPSGAFKRKIRKINGELHLKKAIEDQRGVIIVHPHLGNWEVFNYILGPYKPYALYKPLRNKFLDRIVRKSRERPGTKMLVPFSGTGVRKLYRLLEKGKIIKAFPDQLPDGPGSVVVDFFNVPAGTGTLLPRLIKKTHPAVLCVYAKRLSWARGFDIYIEPAISEIYADNLEQSTTALNKSMERLIRQCPEQYLWGYKRYKYTVDSELYSRNSPVQ